MFWKLQCKRFRVKESIWTFDSVWLYVIVLFLRIFPVSDWKSVERMNVKHAVVVIVGGGSGIGCTCAEQFLSYKAEVILCWL